MKRLGLIALLAVAACGDSTEWSHPTAGADDFRRDAYELIRLAMAAAPSPSDIASTNKAIEDSHDAILRVLGALRHGLADEPPRRRPADVGPPPDVSGRQVDAPRGAAAAGEE